MNTLPVCLMSRVMWKPQAAGWWMKYFSLTLANYAGQAWLCISYCCSRRQCHHRYTCWLLAPKESIFAESEERCLCFQVCLWCSTVRWMNGKYISTKKKKKSGSFSKARTISLILLPELRARCTSVLTTEIVVSVDQPQCWSMCFLFNYRVIYSISPSLFGTRHHFHGRQLSTDSGRGAGLGMIQVHYICCTLYFYYYYIRASLVAQLVKESACNSGDLGSISGLGRSPEEGKGYPLQYSGLKNSMDCIVHGGHKESDTTKRLSLLFFQTAFKC